MYEKPLYSTFLIFISQPTLWKSLFLRVKKKRTFLIGTASHKIAVSLFVNLITPGKVMDLAELYKVVQLK